MLTERLPLPGARDVARIGGRVKYANFSWLFAGNMIYAASQWGLLIVIARTIDPNAVGLFALAIAITGPVFQLANLSLRTVLMTDTVGAPSISDYFGLRLVTTIGGLSFIALLAFMFYPLSTGLIIMAVALGKGIDALSDVFWGEIQRLEQMSEVGKGLISNGVGSLVLLSLVAWVTGSVALAALAAAVVSLYVLVIFAIGSVAKLGFTARLRPRFDLNTLKMLSRLTLPLGIATSLTSLYLNIPRYVIQRELGSYQLGIFAAISYLMVAGNLVMSAAGQSVLPRLSRSFLAGKRELYVSQLAKLAIIGAAIGSSGLVIILSLGGPILTLIYGKEYAGSESLFNWLMLASAIGFLAWYSDYGISAARRFRAQLVVNGFTALVITLASFALIPDHGTIGAAWAMVIGMTFQTIAKSLLIAQTVLSMPIELSSVDQSPRNGQRRGA